MAGGTVGRDHEAVIEGLCPSPVKHQMSRTQKALTVGDDYARRDRYVITHIDDIYMYMGYGRGQLGLAICYNVIRYM